jgi:FlaA1/EpsC-like NDP-sugar epimerase
MSSRPLGNLQLPSLRRVAWHLVTLSSLVLATMLSYIVRFEGLLEPEHIASLSRCLGIVVPIQFFMLMAVAGTRSSIRGLTLRDLWQLVFGVTMGLAVAAPVAMLTGANIPRSIWVIDWFVAISILGGFRGAASEVDSFLRRRALGTAKRVLLVGTCPSSEAVVRAIQSDASPENERIVVGMVAKPEDRDLVGRSTGGVRVLGTTKWMSRLIEKHRIDEVMLLSQTFLGSEVADLQKQCATAGCAATIIPAIHTLIDGNVQMQPRPIEIADLLGRPTVEIDTEGLGRWLGNQTILVTGASGSIGSELCRQLLHHGPERLIVLDRSETGLFWIERELTQATTSTEIIPCVADITDAERVEHVFAEFRPDIVFHAAAYKHVPLMEQHPGEAIRNIPLATATLARAAGASGTATFVMISTDKAVNPTSVMGCCKRVAEMLVQLIAAESETQFSTVRFGNVLNSAGSVVPVFREQILQGGPITVTHPDIERYFMTIPEAARLVIQAGLLGDGGEVFVLDMGEPVRIADLARDMIRLSNLEEGRDIEIRYSGLRPGEKLYEELFTEHEELLETAHPKIRAAHIKALVVDNADTVLQQLEAVMHRPGDEIRVLLHHLVPEYLLPQLTDPDQAVAGKIGGDRTIPLKRSA